MCGKALVRRENISMRNMKQQNKAEVELFRELEASETPLHKIGTDVIGRCWIWIWTWMALWNSICTFILGRGRHSCTTGCSHIFILNSCSSCAACYSLASKLFCALALQKHTADTWQVHLGWGHIFIQTLGKRRGCSED